MSNGNERALGKDEGAPEWRTCEFCGCNTNAKMRGCCDDGRAADGAPSCREWSWANSDEADRCGKPLPCPDHPQSTKEGCGADGRHRADLTSGAATESEGAAAAPAEPGASATPLPEWNGDMMEYLRARMATPAPLPPAQPAEPRAFTALHFDNEEALVVFIDKQLGKEGVGAAPGDVIMEADVAAASDYLRNHAFAAAVPETGALAEIDFVADWLAVTCPEPANRLRRARRALSSPSGDARPDRFLEGWLAGREAAALIFDGDADETELQISDARHTLRTGLAKSLGDVAAAQRSDADRIRALAPPNPSPTPSDK